MTAHENIIVGIRVTPEVQQQIEQIAKRRGYDASDAYLRALIEADAEAHGEALALDDEEDPVEAFREAWRDIMTGNVYPISTLWDDIADE